MTSILCPNFDRNLADCPCTNAECKDRGMCCDCVRNHRGYGSYPACLRYE